MIYESIGIVFAIFPRKLDGRSSVCSEWEIEWKYRKKMQFSEGSIAVTDDMQILYECVCHG